MNVIIKLIPKPAGNASKYAAKNEQNPESNTGENVLDNEQIMWMLTIKASADEARDIANHFGIRHGAMEEWDKYDHVEPPPVGDYVSVAFPHYDWEKYPYAYTVDFRPPSAKNLSWDFDVATNISGEKVTVELLGIDNLPDEYGFILYDRDSNHRIDVKNESFLFISGDNITERHFTIEINKSMSEDNEYYTSRPEGFLTARCYPNPFNPSTTIQYELSQPGRVLITIFNSLGQRVRSYDLGSKDQGIHDFVFNATGMTSGLYFYYVDSGYASVTNKMLFMK